MLYLYRIPITGNGGNRQQFFAVGLKHKIGRSDLQIARFFLSKRPEPGPARCVMDDKQRYRPFWWLAKSCPLLSLLIVLNQHFIKSRTMRQNFDGTKMGQNRRKIKPRPLCSEYPYQNTLIPNTKVQICPVINEPMSLFLSSITHFSIILYHGRFFKVLDTLFHILQLNNVFLIVVQCSERLPIIETAHLYTPFVRLDFDFSVVMKCVALFPTMANCHLKVSHKDVVNCILNQ